MASGLGLSVPSWCPPQYPFEEILDQYKSEAAREDLCCVQDKALLPAWAKPLLVGRSCAIVPLHVGHAEDLFDALTTPSSDATTEDLFKYMSTGPYASAAELRDWIANVAVPLKEGFFMAILAGPSADSKPVGYLGYIEVFPTKGSIEVGYVTFSPQLQRTRTATEAHYLLMANVFQLGYRRYQWKCNSLNLASRRAAQRFGFSFEGTLRQVQVVKGHNRDSTYFSILDSEWPKLREAFEQHLQDSNFDAITGKQMSSLSSLTHPLLSARDPAFAER
mmetsp:Transcript_6607/g.14382  ORF Transcript_6607/g.14382 Transcript_6607/m.14382 type:complete len:277 (-) Transcript_6607:170-1000(-)